MAERVDSHCHLWRLSRGDYGWLRPDVPALAPLYRDFEAPDLLREAGAAGISRKILVQAAPSLAETRHLLEIARGDSGFVAVTGWADLSAASAAADLEALAADPKLRAVRPMLQDLPDPDWIAAAPRPEALAALKRLDLRFEALVTPKQLPALVRFAAAQEDLPIVVDHGAKPPFGAPDSDPLWEVWRRSLAELARAPRIFCKISGLLTELPGAADLASAEQERALRPVVERLLEWFGPERLIWGSDWPVLTLAAPYAAWEALSARLLGDLSGAEQDAILGANAARFYAWKETGE